MSCVFCEILVGARPAHIVYEDEFAVSFVPLNPATLGHVLVVPRVHVRDLFELPYSKVEPLWSAVHHMAHIVNQVMQPDGMNIITSAGEVATQTVFHLHIHVVPRYLTDNMGLVWPKPKYISGVDLPHLIEISADRIKARAGNCGLQ